MRLSVISEFFPRLLFLFICGTLVEDELPALEDASLVFSCKPVSVLITFLPRFSPLFFNIFIINIYEYH